MGLGGIIKRGQQTVEARLLLAYTGRTQFAVTRWKDCHHRWWVLDYINHGQQPQRLGHGKVFTQVSGVAALYAPGRDYCERQIKRLEGLSPTRYRQTLLAKVLGGSRGKTF